MVTWEQEHAIGFTLEQPWPLFWNSVLRPSCAAFSFGGVPVSDSSGTPLVPWVGKGGICPVLDKELGQVLVEGYALPLAADHFLASLIR